MSIVSRYLLLEFARASGAVFLALMLTWMAADTVLHIDSLGEGSLGAFQRILFRALEVVAPGVAISCLAGVVWSLTRAVRNLEITAIRCGGIPLRPTLIPLLIASLLIGAGLILFEDRVMIPTRRVLLEANRRDTATTENRPSYLNGRWWHASGSSIFSAAEYLASERTLRDVTVFKLDPGRRIQQRMDAERAVNLEGNLWEFHGVRVREFSGSQGLEQREVAKLKVELGVSEQDLARAQPPLPVMSLHKLARLIRERKESGQALATLQVGFHARLAEPLAVLLLVLLALPFAIGSAEHGDSFPRALLHSLAAAAVYWTLWSLAVLTGGRGWVPPAFPVWGVTLLFLTVGLWRFRQIKE